MKDYIEFLKDKMAIAHQQGFDIQPEDLTPSLFPHVKDTVRWAVQGGCRAIFSSFGMQKTVTQLEICRIITAKKGGKALIVCPKRVVVEFVTQAKEHLNMTVQYVRTMQEVKACETAIMVTNYERVRDGEDGVRIEPSYFTVTTLDEASVLRGFGTKTYQEFLPLFSKVPYRFVATATPTLDPFHAMCIFHYLRHGFRLFGMITVDTDVVRENNQTYRLGYTEMCKDGSKMGVGCPEYILLFRKLPTNTERAYADDPVTKDKSKYSLARWQIDAHADWKSSGDRLLTLSDISSKSIDSIRKYFRKFAQEHIYSYNQHVAFAEELEDAGRLPKTFMAIDPVSHKDYIWDDVTRMRTLNTRQSQKNKQNHICPLQLDIVERLIERYSNKGDVVFDPFGGIGTVPYCAVKMGRRGLATELNYNYWKDGLAYLREAEQDQTAPTLFDLLNFESNE